VHVHTTRARAPWGGGEEGEGFFLFSFLDACEHEVFGCFFIVVHHMMPLGCLLIIVHHVIDARPHR